MFHLGFVAVVAVPRNVGVVVQLEVVVDLVDLVPFEVLYAKAGRSRPGHWWGLDGVVGRRQVVGRHDQELLSPDSDQTHGEVGLPAAHEEVVSR